MTMRINNWKIKVKTQLLIGLFIMWVSLFLISGGSLYALGLYEQSLGLIIVTFFLGNIGAFIASLEISQENR